MRILIDNSTGFCIGYGDDTLWANNPNAYAAPAFITQQNFYLWQWNKSGDITMQVNWSKQPDPQIPVIADAQYGLSIVNAIFQSIRDSEGLTSDQKKDFVVYTKDAMTFMSWGQIYAARVTFNQLATNNSVGYTNARKNAIISELDTYLAKPPSSATS